MKKKIYILTTLCHYEQPDERAIWSAAFPTRKQAEKAMRIAIKSDLMAYYDGDDEEHDYEKLVDLAIEAGGEEHDAMIDWTADRVHTYDIFTDTIEIKGELKREVAA